jgi:sugar phosphate isomerase/epimerase
MKRRTFVQNSVLGTMAIGLPKMDWLDEFFKGERFGVAEASFMLRRYRNLESDSYPAYANALEMIEHFHTLGFGGAQLTMHGLDKGMARTIRKRLDELDFFMEGQIRLPKDALELDRFEQQVKETKAMGVEVIRTVCLSGRRYENFKTGEEFQAFRKASENALFLAAPIMEKHKVKLAVENHKDWRTAEFLEILEKLDSAYVGVTLDTGNNIALLEEPMEVVRLLAPYTFTVHLKDMALEEYEDGFLMSEVNLGEGFLDLEGMIAIIRAQQPKCRFNLEMITRDPLKIPIWTQPYWETFGDVSRSELVQFTHFLKQNMAITPLPRISGKSVDDQLALEIANNSISCTYAKQQYGFS